VKAGDKDPTELSQLVKLLKEAGVLKDQKGKNQKDWAKKKGGGVKSNTPIEKPKGFQCHKCREYGHFRRDCPNNAGPSGNEPQQ